jgi:CheY-like chemotaxis protein
VQPQAGSVDPVRDRAGVQKQRALVLADAYFKSLVAEVLRDENFSILRAPDAAAALSKLTTEAFDLVVLDYHLPGGMDAGTFTQNLRRNPKAASRRAWVLVFAREVTASDVRQLRNCGVSSLLVGSLQLGRIQERIKVMAQDRRSFVDAPGYVGPDRRVVSEYFPTSQDRREQAKAEAAAARNAADAANAPKPKSPKPKRPAKRSPRPKTDRLAS